MHYLFFTVLGFVQQMNTFPILELQAFFFEVAGSSSLDDPVSYITDHI